MMSQNTNLKDKFNFCSEILRLLVNIDLAKRKITNNHVERRIAVKIKEFEDRLKVVFVNIVLSSLQCSLFYCNCSTNLKHFQESARRVQQTSGWCLYWLSVWTWVKVQVWALQWPGSSGPSVSWHFLSVSTSVVSRRVRFSFVRLWQKTPIVWPFGTIIFASEICKVFWVVLL